MTHIERFAEQYCLSCHELQQATWPIHPTAQKRCSANFTPMRLRHFGYKAGVENMRIVGMIT